MNQRFELTDFVAWLGQFQIDYLVIGGHALRAWGSARFTHDYDFWMRPSDRPAVLQHLGDELAFEMSARPDEPRPVVTASRGSDHIDLLFLRGMTNADGVHLEFNDVFERSVSMESSDGPSVRVPSIADLYALKRMRATPGHYDRGDLEFLEVLAHEAGVPLPRKNDG